jgi:2-haloacid dehalogenase
MKDAKREESVIIGDSLTSDIQGGINCGITTIWFNPGHETSTGVQPDYQVEKLMDIPRLIGEL